MNKKIFVIMLVVLSFLLCACTPAPAAPDQPADQPEAPASADAPLDCVWTLHVDQTIPVETDGMTVNYTLVLIAQKPGGTDVYGTYEGAAYIGTSLDASNLSNEVISVTGGFDMHAFANNLTLDFVPYDIEAYSDFGVKPGEAPIAPLVKYESMALIAPEMTGGGVLNPHVTGVQGEEAGYDAQASGTEAVTMKITVNSGEVRVSVPSFNISHSFEGLLTGTPAGDSALFEQTKQKIEELSAQPEASDASSDDMLGGLGDIFGQSGNNLALPASFAADDFPLLPDANIFNVYESDDKKTVRIMYGTGTAYEDILAFYQPVIDKMNTDAMEVDDGVLYMGSMDGYRSTTLMVLKDETGNYGTIVNIEFSK